MCKIHENNCFDVLINSEDEKLTRFYIHTYKVKRQIFLLFVAIISRNFHFQLFKLHLETELVPRLLAQVKTKDRSALRIKH